MKKILVPTDFSENSKAGLRFALQWSSVEKLDLTFLHVLHISRHGQWTDAEFFEYYEDEKKNCRKSLEGFVADVARSMNRKQGKYSYEVIEGFSPDFAILQYCQQRGDINFICISTGGAGTLVRLLGTNTGNLIVKSKIPVIAIPRNYEASPLKRILYAADFRDYAHELRQVIDFARPLRAPIEVLHFAGPNEVIPGKEIIEEGRQIFKYPVSLHIERSDVTDSIVHNLQTQIELSKPSLAIMFSDQNRPLFQGIFLSSKAEQVSFDLKVPLLVFNKN